MYRYREKVDLVDFMQQDVAVEQKSVCCSVCVADWLAVWTHLNCYSSPLIDEAFWIY